MASPVLPIAICLLNAQGAIMDANAPALCLLGGPDLMPLLNANDEAGLLAWLGHGEEHGDLMLTLTSGVHLRLIKIPDKLMQKPHYPVLMMEEPRATADSKSDLVFRSSILDSIGEAVIATDLAGKILYWNRASELIYGWPAAEALGRDITELTPVERNKALSLEIMAALQQGGSWSGEFMVRHRRGHHFPVYVTDSCLRDQDGRPSVIIGISSDLTERKRLESKLNEQKLALAASERKHLEEASRFKSEFLANMSHEIRTPLAVIRGYAEILFDDMQDVAAKARVLSILEASRQVETLVNDILDITKVEAGKVEVEEIPIALGVLLDEVKGMLEGKARDKKIGFHFHLDPLVPPKIRTDPLRLKQILLNLIGNAIKFTDQGAVHVTVSLMKEGLTSFLSVLVADSGIGMTPEQSQKIFRPFGQADASIGRAYGGTGLGLFLSARLATLLGGQLVLEKTAPGLGSSFRLTLPLQAASEFRPPWASPLTLQPQSSPQLRGMRILVVEDAYDVRAIVRKFLEKEEAQVAEASNGEEALNLVKEQSFDAILMDLQMPICDGFQALRSLKAQRYARPIFALTAHAMSGERERCLAAGFSGYFTKPIHFRDMIAVLGSWREGPKGLRSNGH